MISSVDQYAAAGLGACTKIAAGSSFTQRGNQAALDQLRDQALCCSSGNAGMRAQKFGQGQSVLGCPDAAQQISDGEHDSVGAV